ncbi:N-acetylmuramoyl-L-alanine amidase [Acidovorax sp. GBBC 3334]|uniref:peptidoglycan recognition protein family protein n=1 Tax=Acidovorax sp. GBBC 3334 TaxID=2940496 RepID=UPI0023023650|nr:peptidoglycan recognition family protein [Acidovorax sp. GBBC 3334]MDA8455496.1 N-acetylmuramoyl-L-alanine amidase [Acidovorax sp. GBBC 3334]
MDIDKSGKIRHPRIKLSIHGAIEQGEMRVVNGIIVHQTGASTAQSSFNSYKGSSPNGAHFLIDKDGTIYQTASLYRKTYHVGFIKSRCLAEHKCTPGDLKALQGKTVGRQIGTVEKQKVFPARYPDNSDSIGIEIVSAVQGQTFESVTNAQQLSLRWLVAQLTATLGISVREIYRHPQVSWKNETEASTAQW